MGIALEKTDGTGDLLVKCMKQRGHNFFWPQREDKVIISIDHVICLLSLPLIHGRSGRQYEITEEEKITIVVWQSIIEWLDALLFFFKTGRTSYFEVGGHDGWPNLISDGHIFLRQKVYFSFPAIVVECLN